MIQTNDTPFIVLGSHAARLGPNHGYSIDGDVALLHAEVAMPADRQAAQPPWALQLWACDAPHSGGPVSGVKVAEAALPVPASTPEPLRLDTEALASVPGGLRDYSMVLVLASGDQVHDFANYPERQRFITPHLEGSVGYRLEGDHVVVKSERIRNPRHRDNLSGSLSLELWALPSSYRGGAVHGAQLANVELGRLAGQSSLDTLEQRVPFSPPAAGEWQMVLILREWAGAAGAVTRDYCNFAAPYTQPATSPEQQNPAELSALAATPEAIESKPAPATPQELATPEAHASKLPTAAPQKPSTPAAHDNELDAAAPQKPTVPELPDNAPTGASSSSRELRAKPLTPAPAAKTASLQPNAAVAAANPAAQPVVADRVSILSASVEELTQVKGLNRKLAVEIIKGRPFKTLDELVRVRGIGPKLLSALRAHLTL